MYVKDEHGMYIREFNEGKIQLSSEFKEVWDISFPIERLSARYEGS
jgi:hypothetical protein